MKGMLLWSSLGMVVNSIPFIVISNCPMKNYYLLGLTTSVLNQNNKNLFRYLGRGTMVVGAILDTYYLHDSIEYFLWFLAIKCYFISKITGNKCFHVLAHFFVTLLHNSILINN